MCDSNIKYVSEKLYDRYIKYAVFELEIWKVETGHLSAIMIFRHFNCHLLLFAAAGSGLLFSSTTFYKFVCLCFQGHDFLPDWTKTLFSFIIFWIVHCFVGTLLNVLANSESGSTEM